MKNKTYDFINNFKIHVCGAVKTVSHYISKYMAKSEKQIFAVCGRTTDIINKKLKDRRSSKKDLNFLKSLKLR